MSSIADDFNSANSAALGHNLAWTDTDGDFQNDTNSALVSGSNTLCRSRSNTALATDTHEASIDITSLSTPGALTNDQIGVCLRFDPAANTCYDVRVVRQAINEIYLYRVVAGTPTQVGSPVTITLTSLPHSFKARVETVGGSARLTFFLDGTQQGSPIDDTSPITSNTSVGILGFHGSLGDSVVRGDNFLAVDYSSGATAYTMTGPTAGPNGSASSNFTLTPNGATSVTITPSDSGAGGTFTPSSLTWSNDASAKTFTYTASSTGAKMISVTDSGSLSDPSPITYASKVTTTRPYTVDGGVPGSVTVGYMIKNNDATKFAERVTAGIVDQGGGTFSAASVTVPSDLAGIIQWDDNQTIFASEVLNNTSGSGGTSGGGHVLGA